MTSSIAIYSGDTIIYWSALVICLAVAAWFCLSYAMYTAHGGYGAAMWAFLPLACALALIFSRAMHWYCHAEQYSGFASAFKDFSLGSYCMPGVLLGVVLAALLVRLMGLCSDTPRLLDALAPGAALGIGIMRLSALFNSSCRGKIVITDPKFQHLPIGAAVSDGAGGVEYRFATFFAQFLLLVLLAVVLVGFYYARRRRGMKSGSRGGHTAMLFLLLYSASDIVLDSTRYDSSFLRSNGFVSASQIIGALCILGVLVYYSVHSIKANSLRFYHWLLWAAFLGTVGGVGYLEYLVQRHGDWYLKCYSGMSACCAAMALTVYVMYLTVCAPRRKKKRRE